MPYKKYPLLSKKKLKTISIKDRTPLLDTSDFSKPIEPGSDFQGFIKSLPHAFAAKEIIEFCLHVKFARKKNKPIILGLNEHIVKSGLSPIIIDLMERGWVSAVAVDGSFMLSDFEVALSGKSYENARENLHKGAYLNTEESGLFLNVALKEGFEQDMGIGEAVGQYLMSSGFPFHSFSVIHQAYKLNIPVTVHITVGGNFFQYHPKCDAAVMGKMAEIDFILFSSVISQIGDGGIFIHSGCCDIFPEIFLNAIAFCTAQNIELKNFYTTAIHPHISDLSSHAVISPSITNGGKTYRFTDSPEILIPLMAAILLNV